MTIDRQLTSKHHSDRRRFLGQVGGSVAGVALVGCGGGQTASTATGAPPPAPSPVVATVITPETSPVAPPTSPAPVPVPAPVTSPLPVITASAINFQPISLEALVLIGHWHTDSRYARYRVLDRWTGDSATVSLRGFDLGDAGGGVDRPLGSGSYTLTVDGVAVGTTPVSAGAKAASVTFSTLGMAAGWRRLELQGLAAGETAPIWWAYLIRGEVKEDALMPVVKGTYELTMHAGPFTNTWVMAPSRYAPTPRPLPPRTSIPFSNKLSHSQIACRQIVPFRFGDVHRPNVSKEGLLSAFDYQPYNYYDLTAKMPIVPLLDGPRGVGTVCMTTHIELGTAVVNGVPRNSNYVCTPWSVLKITQEGVISTLVGYRHKNGVMTHWEDPVNVELIGDWSAIPAERQGFHELWGMTWDARTLSINPSAPLVDGETPHVVGPVMFVADLQMGRICKMTFHPADRGVPRVTEHIVGLADPFDVRYRMGLLYVSERGANRVAAYDATTGAFVKVVVQQAGLGPEGLALLDDWLYYGSLPKRLVSRVNLTTGVIEVVGPLQVDGNSTFCKIAVSDGTFQPKGTVFSTTWSNAQYGYPATLLPDGTDFTWYYGELQPGQWAGFTYPSAVAVGQGKLLLGGSNEGILMFDQAQSSDLVPTEAVARGAADYMKRGLHLLHGAYGFGFYGLPLPWGVTSDIDAFLAQQGHLRG